MSIGGHYCKKFRDANCATMVDVHMNGDYDFWYALLRVDGKRVTLRGRMGKPNFEKEVKVDKAGYEYFMVEHVGAYSQLFAKGRPERIKCMPFFDETGEFKGHRPEIVGDLFQAGKAAN